MQKLKKLSALSLSTILSLGILTPHIGAQTLPPGEHERTPVKMTVAKPDVTKTDLIEKVNTLFPGRFDFLQESDYELTTDYPFLENSVPRYHLSFYKNRNGVPVRGQFRFIGERLELESFSYHPADVSDALFPLKADKEEAQKMAEDFLRHFSQKGDYRLDTMNDFQMENQTLVEPLRYTFSFVRSKDAVPIDDQQITITVLGNGEIVEFDRTYTATGNKTFDDLAKALPTEEILNLVKEHLSLQLQYHIDYDYQTGEPFATLVYRPTERFAGVHALSGKWLTFDGFKEKLPQPQEIKRLAQKPLPPRDGNFTLEKARSKAKDLLAVHSEHFQLKITAIEETKNEKGQDVYRIRYAYGTNSGEDYRGELEFARKSGDLVRYQGVMQGLLKSNSSKKLSLNEAKEKAVLYLKAYAPSYLHDYAMPLEAGSLVTDGMYTFIFPRVVNGLIVDGDEIIVSLHEDGSLAALEVDKLPIDHWPAVKEAMTKEAAKATFLNEANVELRYIRRGKKPHYDLVYMPVYNHKNPSLLHAETGEWYKSYSNGNSGEISHSWAEKELNHLINMGILKIGEKAAFDGNQAISKGEALDILVRSLTPSYEAHAVKRELNKERQSFVNIHRDHPLYPVVEQAVNSGILEAGGIFAEKEPITREELALWYIRTLKLEQTAMKNIYTLDSVDQEKVDNQYAGAVALANSRGILTVNKQGYFYPKDNVTYAQMAVSILRLAKQM